jgi:hypothetical protein
MSLAWWGNTTGADEEWRNVVCQVVEALRSLRVAGGQLPARDAAVIKSRKRKRQADEDTGNDTMTPHTTGGCPSRQTKSVCRSCLAMCIDFFS